MSKHIVVTGCSQGLGKALIEGFIEAGHTVSGCARSAEKIHSLTEHHGAAHSFSAVDVSDTTQVYAWANKCLENHGPADLVINLSLIHI